MSQNTEITFPDTVKYAATHEWVRVEGDTAIVGITAYAQDALGDIVFVELPEVGKILNAGNPFGVIESVKAASDVFVPVSGTLAAVNEVLAQTPETINQDPFGAGWLLKISPFNASDVNSLMDAASYRGKIESGEIH
jgi:glycine cleavage system H protein